LSAADVDRINGSRCDAELIREGGHVNMDLTIANYQLLLQERADVDFSSQVAMQLKADAMVILAGLESSKSHR
jgi:hypothetical protein